MERAEVGFEEPENAASPEGPDAARLRFEIELEFLQLLAHPMYLQYLAQRGFMKDRSFINYLEYLQYWKRPEYVKFVVFPDSLAILDLLQHEAFREEIAKQEVANFVHEHEFHSWFTARKPALKAETTGDADGKPDETMAS